MTATSKRYLAITAVVYSAMIAVLVGGLFVVRRNVLRDLSTPQARNDWQQWRRDVEEQQREPQVVARRVPKSEEPPALVLMRDYFVTCLIGAVMFVSLLFWAIAGLTIGAVTSKGGAS